MYQTLHYDDYVLVVIGNVGYLFHQFPVNSQRRQALSLQFLTACIRASLSPLLSTTAPAGPAAISEPQESRQRTTIPPDPNCGVPPNWLLCPPPERAKKFVTFPHVSKLGQMIHRQSSIYISLAGLVSRPVDRAHKMSKKRTEGAGGRRDLQRRRVMYVIGSEYVK